MNEGLRIVLDLRGGKFWWTLTERGEQHESRRGYSTLHEAVEHAELYRRMLKPMARAGEGKTPTLNALGETRR